MYMKVDSFALLNEFNQIWMECWVEKGYGFEMSEMDADRFLIIDPNEQKVGTIEFKPYSLHPTNNINSVFPFHELEKIKSLKLEQIMEIDKVAILKNHRGKNLERLLTLYVDYAQSRQITHCVVLLERVFFRALKTVYKIPLETAGEKIYYKGDYVIPAILYPQEIYEHKDKFSWLIQPKDIKRKTIFK
ncbi:MULTISPECIES: hypothetical protein [Bacillaceae]|uniref:hypothetical protein n=1 Tax=Bacillaceae TaxID=186817 RepID=UPI001E3AFF2A|nr:MULTISPECIES: hypothetical protein [Bacillaceae]MCE4047596.1 hypothetical protein [Bacillus sp. Au-Bac7]MCM3034009.1 hypothetical protein [Niallia sp. MER 6]MDL0436206.1 hypothetical protein [Niallia sp. SS-2023]UPO86061.1 hypothetical protein L8T27_010520 [Niallia sp. Man26]